MVEIGFWFGVAIYTIVWFLTLSIVMPFGVTSQQEAEGDIVPGTAESAPTQPQIGSKLFYTTVLAGGFYWLVYWVVTTGVIMDISRAPIAAVLGVP